MGRLDGKVAFITGAGRGQGRSHALRFAAEGADLILIDICRNLKSAPYPLSTPADLSDTARLAEASGARVIAREADVRDSAALEQVLAEGNDLFGRLDIVCANAGIVALAPVADMTDEAWDEVIGTNLTGAFRTVRAALPHIRRGGRGGSIVITSSTAAMNASINLAHYTAAKHGLTGLVRVLAKELAAEMIRVNAVLPTSVNTPMIHNVATYEKFLPDRTASDLTPDDVAPVYQALNLLPVPWVEPADVTNAVMWLVSDEARMVTGVQLPVDAGKTAR